MTEAGENIIPYVSPVVWSFEAEDFVAEAERQRAAMLARLDDVGLELERHGPWLQRQGALDEVPGSWRIKLYLCVEAPDYWAVVERVLTSVAVARHCTGMKVMVFADPALSIRGARFADMVFARPDKIVVYCGAMDQLEPLLESIADARQAASCHSLGHTCRPHHYDLLSAHRDDGIHVGLDPRFLPISWRSYRPVVLTWTQVNRDALREEWASEAAWLEAMNISIAHEGPLSLSPTVETNRFITAQWRRIVDEDFENIY